LVTQRALFYFARTIKGALGSATAIQWARTPRTARWQPGQPRYFACPPTAGPCGSICVKCARADRAILCSQPPQSPTAPARPNDGLRTHAQWSSATRELLIASGAIPRSHPPSWILLSSGRQWKDLHALAARRRDHMIDGGGAAERPSPAMGGHVGRETFGATVLAQKRRGPVCCACRSSRCLRSCRS
jgi:hypothetical protein